MFLLFAAFASASTIVVDFQDNTPSSEIFALENGTAHDARWADETLVDESIALYETDNVAAALAYFESLPNVTSVEPRTTYSISAISFISGDEPDLKPNDPEFAKQWHMGEIDAPWAWTNTKGGEGIVVAVLDTGFALTADMDPKRVLPGKSFAGKEPVTDGHGHGTHCASTIGEVVDNGTSGTGVARAVTILPVKVLSDEGYGYNDWIAGGIRWATDQGADVISMSLGGPSASGVIRDAVNYAIEHDVIVVAAAGNDGCKNCIGYPAKYPGVISVGATGPDHKRSYYSSYGPELILAAPGGNKKLPAGGVWQLTRYEGREQFLDWQGTSMATPHVAGAVAVLLGEGAEPKQVQNLLTSTARGDKSIEVGAGIINLKDAVKSLRGEKSATIATVPPGAAPVERTTVLGLLAIGFTFLMAKLYGTSRNFALSTAIFAGIFGGALAPLNLLPLSWSTVIPGAYHLLDLPDLLFGAFGFSSFPLWLSPLLALPAVFIFTPLKRTRPFVAGLLAALGTYFFADLILMFNAPWGLDLIGGRVWLALSAFITFALSVVVHEFHSKRSE